MSLWTVTLEKPGRPDRQVIVGYLSPWMELPVDRISVWQSWDEDRLLLCHASQTIFIETYALMSLNPDTAKAWAEYRSIRRSHELPRKFNPARLPA